MKKIFSLCLACVLMFCFSACNVDQNTPGDSTAGNNTTDPQNEVTEPTPARFIEYPELSGEGEDYTKINSLIRREVDNWITNEIFEDVALDLHYTVTCNDTRCVSVLFEGNIESKKTAYPSKVIFPVTVSKTDNVIIDSFRYVLADEGFLEKFEPYLTNTIQSESYSQEQQDAITSYLYGTAGFLQYRLTKADAVISENGLIVYISVPHAIGDYIKVEVPMAKEDLDIIFRHESDTLSSFGETFTLYKVSDSYELYCAEGASGYFFNIYDMNSILIDSGYQKSTTDVSKVGDLIELWFSAGMSNRRVKYYDLEGGRVSRLFHNPLAVYEELVIYIDFVNDTPCFVIQNIFDPSTFYKVFEMNPAPASALPNEAEFIDSTHIQVSYMIQNDEIYSTIIELP